MHNLASTPSPEADDRNVDAADWVEINCLLRADGSVSREDLARALTQGSNVGEQTAREIAADAYSELADRENACGPSEAGAINEYPFFLNAERTLLSLKPGLRNSGNRGLVYRFLLVTTRADMGSATRVLDRVDPTKVFERLCADVLVNFWGGRSLHVLAPWYLAQPGRERSIPTGSIRTSRSFASD